MNIRANRYNDPALGQAFTNIASIFAPPSAQDMAGYATANAKKQEAARLSQLFEAAGGDFDKMGMAVGHWNPTQSFYAQNQNNATTIRGQDVVANTSITNNTADNARALATNAADNERAVATNLTDNQFKIGGQFMTPLNPGQVQPGLPATLADMYGLPELPRTEGLPKPLSLDETKALTYGRMDPALQEAMTFGSTPIEQILQDDGTAMNVTALDALGQTPVPPSQGSQAAPDVQNYRAPDGTSGTAVYRDGTGWVDTQTNQPIPQGSLTMKANATGSADEVIGPRPQNLTRARQLRSDITSMNSLVGELETTIRSAAGTAGLAASIQSFFQDSRQVVKELAAATGEDPNAPITPEGLKALSENLLGVERGYNPTFRRVHAMMLDLAYMNARLNNPSGEVSRFALEREIEALGQGMTGNDQSVLAAIDVARQRMARGLSQAEVLEGRSDGSTLEDVLRPAGGPVGPEIGEVVEGHRFLGGDPAQQSSWEKVQ